MKTSKTFSIHFWLKRTAEKNNGQIPIYVRITVDGIRADLSAKRFITEDHWSSEAGRVRTRVGVSKGINGHLDDIYWKLMDCHKQLGLESILITAQAIKLRYLGKDKVVQTLKELIKYHRENDIKKLAPGTAKNYSATEKYLDRFIEKKFRTHDVYLAQIDYSFVVNFETYLRTCPPIRKCQPLGNNGIMKHMERLQKFTTLALKFGWLKRNPFALYALQFEEYDSPFLEQLELDAIDVLEIQARGIGLARDVFVFACNTGLCYIDVKNLTAKNIVTGIDGEEWIMVRRQKSKTSVKVPLLDKAKEILERHVDYPCAENNFSLLPVLSCQKINDYLKILARRCEIDKNLTFHVARHTFATTITLLNDVPIATVSKLLGHKKLTTTQKYARVIEKKISKDMMQLKEKLIVNSKKNLPNKRTSNGHLQIV